MIKQLIYNPFLQKNIPVKAESQVELESYIKTCEQLRDKSTRETWHILDAVLQAHLEVLDNLRKDGDILNDV